MFVWSPENAPVFDSLVDPTKHKADYNQSRREEIENKKCSAFFD